VHAPKPIFYPYAIVKRHEGLVSVNFSVGKNIVGVGSASPRAEFAGRRRLAYAIDRSMSSSK
jgi:hypothetical protein